MSTQDVMKNMARDFKLVKQAADTFIQWANAQLELVAALPQKRKRKRKMMADEMTSDESLTDANSAYEVEVHNQIMDTITESIHRRFLTHGTLYADLALLDPRNFAEVLLDALPDSAFQELSKYLLRFDSRATAVSFWQLSGHSIKCLHLKST